MPVLDIYGVFVHAHNPVPQHQPSCGFEEAPFHIMTIPDA